jgi:hypothetical protein
VKTTNPPLERLEASREQLLVEKRLVIEKLESLELTLEQLQQRIERCRCLVRV